MASIEEIYKMKCDEVLKWMGDANMWYQRFMGAQEEIRRLVEELNKMQEETGGEEHG